MCMALWVWVAVLFWDKYIRLIIIIYFTSVWSNFGFKWLLVFLVVLLVVLGGILFSYLSCYPLILPLRSDIGSVVKIVYRTFSTEHAAQWAATHIICYYHYRQRAGWWWKSSIRPFPQIIVHSELLPTTLVMATTVRGRVGGKNRL